MSIYSLLLKGFIFSLCGMFYKTLITLASSSKLQSSFHKFIWSKTTCSAGCLEHYKIVKFSTCVNLCSKGSHFSVMCLIKWADDCLVRSLKLDSRKTFVLSVEQCSCPPWASNHFSVRWAQQDHSGPPGSSGVKWTSSGQSASNSHASLRHSYVTPLMDYRLRRLGEGANLTHMPPHAVKTTLLAPKVLSVR